MGLGGFAAEMGSKHSTRMRSSTDHRNVPVGFLRSEPLLRGVILANAGSVWSPVERVGPTQRAPVERPLVRHVCVVLGG